MADIPHAIETDSEDVAWALQTADALWKRDERQDAIVWLRRAAQAAGDAEDDDRALTLARGAAELVDWMGRAVSAESPAPIPTAAELHAGMLDPWAESEPAREERDSSEPPATDPLSQRSARSRDADDVVTSAPAVAALRVSPVPVASDPSPARARASARAPAVSANEAPAGRTDDLGIPPDWPDEVRLLLARAAAVRQLAPDEEVAGFGLVSVLDGEVDVAATIVDAPAERLRPGDVLRARGTVRSVVPLRVIGAAGGARVATWSDSELAHALGPWPALEDALRAAGNRVQALAGATMGPLGDRLDTALRAGVMSRLGLHVVGEGEIFAKAGDAIPGLLVVGAGELELFGESGASDGALLRSGDFLFPSEVLRAAVAPRSVRAAKGGALVLMAARALAQELLVTCPPLLEIFAEG